MECAIGGLPKCRKFTCSGGTSVQVVLFVPEFLHLSFYQLLVVNKKNVLSYIIFISVKVRIES